MSSVLFAGGRLESFTIVSGSPYDYTANSARWDATYSDAGLSLNGGVVSHPFLDGSGAATTVVAGQTLYWHATIWWYAMNAGNGVTFYDSAGYPWLYIYGVQDTSTFQVRANTGSGASPTWTTLGSYSATSGSTADLDIAFTLGANGTHTVAVYYAGTDTKAGGTFTNAALTNIASVRLLGSGSAPLFSQVLATVGSSTIGAKVKTLRATGAGNYAEWTGAYTDVNETGDNDTTTNSAATAGLRQSYPVNTVTVPTGYSIKSVFHWLRAKNDGASPANIKSLLRVGGSDYVTADLPGVAIGYTAVGTRYDTNPATSAAWTQAAVNTPIQLGFVSDT